MMKSITPTAMLLAVFSACSGAALAQLRPVKNLCRAPELVLFSCHVGVKLVSICGREQSGGAYRYGQPGHVELAASIHGSEAGHV